MRIAVHRSVGDVASWTEALRLAGMEVARPRGANVALIGVTARRLPRRPHSAWVVVESDTVDESRLRALAATEAILCTDHDIRGRLEHELPEQVPVIFHVPDPRTNAGEAARRIARIATRLLPSAPGPNVPGPLRFGVVGYNLKFFSRIADHFKRLDWMQVRVDEWPRFASHDEALTREIVEWADFVFCEWCGPNAVYASTHRSPSQHLAVRLHRFELDTDHWRDVDISAVDRVITVSPFFRERVVETTGWPPEKVVTIPNWVDDLDLDRPKLPQAPFGIGMLGASTARKRLDRAVDVLARVRERDPRFRLFVKTQLPTEFRWVWAEEREREVYEGVLRRIETDPLLAGAVEFDPFGPDVGDWLRKIGFVVSTSDDESFHLAPAEAMASGAIPVVWRWPGADTIYSERWLVDSEDAMADRIVEVGPSPGEWEQLRRRAQDEAREFALDDVLRRWTSLVADIVEGE